MSIVVNNMADRGATPYFGYVAWRIRIYFRIVLFVPVEVWISLLWFAFLPYGMVYERVRLIDLARPLLQFQPWDEYLAESKSEQILYSSNQFLNSRLALKSPYDAKFAVASLSESTEIGRARPRRLCHAVAVRVVRLRSPDAEHRDGRQ